MLELRVSSSPPCSCFASRLSSAGENQHVRTVYYTAYISPSWSLRPFRDDWGWFPLKTFPVIFSEVTVRSRSFTQNYETEPLWDHFPHWPSSIHHLWWVPCEADEHFAHRKIGDTPQDQDPGAQALNKTAAHIGHIFPHPKLQLYSTSLLQYMSTHKKPTYANLDVWESYSVVLNFEL